MFTQILGINVIYDKKKTTVNCNIIVIYFFNDLFLPLIIILQSLYVLCKLTRSKLNNLKIEFIKNF